MRLHTILLLTLASLAFAADETRPELLGHWTMTGSNNKPLDTDKFQIDWEFTADQIIVRDLERLEEISRNSYTVDFSKSPAWITVTLAGPTPETRLGIFRISGDELYLKQQVDAGERPANFDEGYKVLRRVARADEDVYNPIAVGLRWEYSVDLTTPSGRTFHGSMTREITGTEVIAGKTYFVSSTRFAGLPGMQPFITYRRKAADGIYTINGFDPQKKEYLETALPLSVGKSWQAITDDTTTVTIAAQEDITVGDHQYKKCFKIFSVADSTSPSGAYYLAPNVGNVRDSARQGGATFEFTLTKFTGVK